MKSGSMKERFGFISVLMLFSMMLQIIPFTAMAKDTVPVAKWHFDEGKSSKTVADSNGNNKGTISGAVWDYGKIGKALRFDGKTTYVEIPHSDALSPKKALTVEAWINPYCIKPWKRIVSKSKYPNSDYSLIRGDKSNVGILVKIGSKEECVYSAENSVPLGVWSYIVGTYDGANLKLYINGKLVGSKKVTGEINTQAEPLRIGGDGVYFKGVIDEVGIYNSALTADEILSHYKAVTQSAKSSATVAVWHFSEGKGTTTADLSKNANNGKIGGATWVKGKIGNALKFDGKNDYVDIPYKANLNPKKALTVETWVNPSTNGKWVRILSKSGYPNMDYSLFQGGNNNIVFSVKIGKVIQSVYSPKNSVPVGKWSYVAGTYDGASLKVYINGKLAGSIKVSGDINNHAQILRIGGDPTGAYFKGMIDEVSIYSKALTAVEIANHYKAVK